MERLLAALLRLPLVMLATFFGQRQARQRREEYIAAFARGRGGAGVSARGRTGGRA